jgi:hypothetical protein
MGHLADDADERTFQATYHPGFLIEAGKAIALRVSPIVSRCATVRSSPPSFRVSPTGRR